MNTPASPTAKTRKMPSRWPSPLQAMALIAGVMCLPVALVSGAAGVLLLIAGLLCFLLAALLRLTELVRWWATAWGERERER